METLSWEKLESHIAKATPTLLAMGGARGVLIGFNPVSGRLFLRLPLEKGAKVPPSPYAELNLEARMDESKEVLEIYTQSRHLFQEFHRLAGLLTESFERADQTAVNAFLEVVERWRELTIRRDLLSAEEQLGLMGELLVLDALIGRNGPAAVSSWTGRMETLPERHDFRIGDIDLEVKTTRTSSRHHVIHGLRQLEPSRGHSLFLVSLRFEAAGMANGTSLADYVRKVRIAIAGHQDITKEFEKRLAAARYRSEDETHYQERLVHADIPMLIPVDENFPRLVTTTLYNAIGPTLAGRIGVDVTYRVNVDGLGKPLSSSRHAELFAPIPMEDK